MAPTTVPISAPNNLCPHCGALYTLGDTQCPKCEKTIEIAAGAKYDDKPIQLQTPAETPPRLSSRQSVILEFAPSGQCVTLDIPNSIILGRTLGPGTAEVLDLTRFKAHRRGVSRRHAVLRRYTNRLVISDLGSTNGTFVNNKRLETREEHTVNHGDTIILGEFIITVYFASQDE